MGKSSRLAKEQRRALGRLTRLAALEPFYLAGGTAIAWHLHHRQSLDLDLFSEGSVDLDAVERAVKGLAGVEVISISDAVIKLQLEGSLVDLVAYPYPPLEKPAPGPEGCRVASLLDLAVMKLGAVARRGIRRDFWDLKVILQSGFALLDVAQAYERRFKVSEGDLYPVLRALTYFDDAEKDPTLPGGLTQLRWSAIKRFFIGQAAKVMRAMTTEAGVRQEELHRGATPPGTRRRSGRPRR